MILIFDFKQFITVTFFLIFIIRNLLLISILLICWLSDVYQTAVFFINFAERYFTKFLIFYEFLQVFFVEILINQHISGHKKKNFLPIERLNQYLYHPILGVWKWDDSKDNFWGHGDLKSLIWCCCLYSSLKMHISNSYLQLILNFLKFIL